MPALGIAFVFTSGPFDRPSFQPAAGTKLTKEFSTGYDLTLDDLSLTVNGQDIGEMVGQVEFTLGSEGTIEVTDTYKAVTDGRPIELLRTFGALRSTTKMEVSPGDLPDPEMTGRSALEGKTVRFRWNEEDQDYECSYTEDSGDDALLAGLREDMDFRVFLPASDVKVDEAWTVPLSKLVDVMMPGGNLRVLPDDLDFDQDSLKVIEDLMARFGERSEELLDGECKCTYKGQHEEQGVRVAEIELDLEVSAVMDLAEFMNSIIQEQIDKAGAGEMVQMSIDTADFNAELDGSGTLLWNIEAGRAHSFQAAGDVTTTFDLVIGFEVDGESQDVEASAELSGTVRQSALIKE